MSQKMSTILILSHISIASFVDIPFIFMLCAIRYCQNYSSLAVIAKSFFERFAIFSFKIMRVARFFYFILYRTSSHIDRRWVIDLYIRLCTDDDFISSFFTISFFFLSRLKEKSSRVLAQKLNFFLLFLVSANFI